MSKTIACKYLNKKGFLTFTAKQYLIYFPICLAKETFDKHGKSVPSNFICYINIHVQKAIKILYLIPRINAQHKIFFYIYLLFSLVTIKYTYIMFNKTIKESNRYRLKYMYGNKYKAVYHTYFYCILARFNRLNITLHYITLHITLHYTKL